MPNLAAIAIKVSEISALQIDRLTDRLTDSQTHRLTDRLTDNADYIRFLEDRGKRLTSVPYIKR